jgi:hypothetical protein
MIVAVVAVRMVQVPIHQVIHMVAVRNRFVSACWSVDVRFLVAGTGMSGSAGIGIGARHRQGMLIDVVAVNVVEMAVVQIIGMAIVLDWRVTAIGTVLMAMTLMRFAFFHGNPRKEKWWFPNSRNQFIGIPQPHLRWLYH